jgi:hypothetical protein
MFEAQFTGADALIKKLDAVSRQIHSLQTYVPREVADWRSENLGSKYPAPFTTKRRRVLKVRQRIFSRGRGSLRKNLKRRRKRGYARRPVLREGLWDELKKRVIELVHETVKWP